MQVAFVLKGFAEVLEKADGKNQRSGGEGKDELDVLLEKLDLVEEGSVPGNFGQLWRSHARRPLGQDSAFSRS